MDGLRPFYKNCLKWQEMSLKWARIEQMSSQNSADSNVPRNSPSLSFIVFIRERGFWSIKQATAYATKTPQRVKSEKLSSNSSQSKKNS